MSITNEPILLNETGLMLVDRMDRQNALLSMMAAGNRATAYSNISQVAGVIRANTVEQNKRLFPVGDQIIVPWKDMDDQSHNTDETAYQVPLDIVSHELVELQGGYQVPGMYLQWHYSTPYGVQFSNCQAFKACPSGLAAGTYYITFGETWGNAVAAEPWSFTLTQAVPAGGLLSGFEGMSDAAANTWQVKSWASPSAAAPIETVGVVSGAAGTNLGTMNQFQRSADGINGMQNVGYGNNRWDTSALRQYLNGSGNNWWASSGEFDIRPDQYAKKGFLTGFNADFLAEIKPVKVVTALNPVEGHANTSAATYDTFFLPGLEQMFISPEVETVEGAAWEYWKRRLGRTSEAARNVSYPNLVTTGIDNISTAQIVRTRSAVCNSSRYTWRISVGGNAGSYSGAANTTIRYSPVCVIC